MVYIAKRKKIIRLLLNNQRKQKEKKTADMLYWALTVYYSWRSVLDFFAKNVASKFCIISWPCLIWVISLFYFIQIFFRFFIPYFSIDGFKSWSTGQVANASCCYGELFIDFNCIKQKLDSTCRDFACKRIWVLPYLFFVVNSS